MVIFVVSTALFFKLYSSQPYAVDFTISMSYFQLLVKHIRYFLLAFVMSLDPAFPLCAAFTGLLCHYGLFLYYYLTSGHITEWNVT